MAKEPLRKDPLCRGCGILLAKVLLDEGEHFHPLCSPRRRLRVVRDDGRR